MSMIIRDFDLPKAGEVLILKIFPDRGVVVCPGTECEAIDNIVVPIPKRHGRLIDADALKTVFKDMAKCEWNQKAFPISWAYAFEDTIDEIDNAPTIFEAEDLL